MAADFDAFQRVIAGGLQRCPVELFNYCVVLNHWHLVVRRKTDEAAVRA
jgi:hypothetical protein